MVADYVHNAPTCPHICTGFQPKPYGPTIANSPAIQSRGVLQVESGYDAYPQRVPGNQQTVDSLLTYTPLVRLRMDFGWSALNHQEEGGVTTNGVDTMQIGGKLELRKEKYHRVSPGIAVQYEAELPTASQEALQVYGQQAIFLLNHHYGKNGDLDVIVNSSLSWPPEAAVRPLTAEEKR